MVEQYNKKLKEKYGDKIIVKLISCYDDDGNMYYVYIAKFGASDIYETLEQAYKAADDYLTNIDLYI